MIAKHLAGMGDRLLLGASRLATCSSVNFFSSLSPPRFSPALDMICGRKWGFKIRGSFWVGVSPGKNRPALMNAFGVNTRTYSCFQIRDSLLLVTRSISGTLSDRQVDPGGIACSRERKIVIYKES